ncbi:uncharacterized protein LOC131945739 [Physella acuta]|uniref:uncharacterized protein LOC131945739 n=1 Tax=Physella acuta TaxID=109671 RepID=UPI0027DE0FEF|nr:uncharacterized protein LOC131945739 [Physella acuta]
MSHPALLTSALVICLTVWLPSVRAPSTMALTLEMNSLYNIKFSLDVFTQLYKCLCDVRDQSCSVVLSRDHAFSYHARFISASSFPRTGNQTRLERFSRNFVCTIPTSFLADMTMGCIRLKHVENVCENLELCESLNLLHERTCETGFVGIYWLYPGRINVNLDTQRVSASHCGTDCFNASAQPVDPAVTRNISPDSSDEFNSRDDSHTNFRHSTSLNNQNDDDVIPHSRHSYKTKLSNPKTLPTTYEDDVRTATITGIACGAALVALISTILGICVCRKSKQSQVLRATTEDSIENQDPLTRLREQRSSNSFGTIFSQMESHSKCVGELQLNPKKLLSPKTSVETNKKGNLKTNGSYGSMNDEKHKQWDKGDNLDGLYNKGDDFDISDKGSKPDKSTQELGAASSFQGYNNIPVRSCRKTASYDEIDEEMFSKVSGKPNEAYSEERNSYTSGREINLYEDLRFSSKGQSSGSKGCYSRLNEEVRIITNPYNMLSPSRSYSRTDSNSDHYSYIDKKSKSESNMDLYSHTDKHNVADSQTDHYSYIGKSRKVDSINDQYTYSNKTNGADFNPGHYFYIDKTSKSDLKADPYIYPDETNKTNSKTDHYAYIDKTIKSIVSESEVSNTSSENLILDDDAQTDYDTSQSVKAQYENFKYRRLPNLELSFKEVPESARLGSENNTRTDLQRAESLGVQNHVYFELEKDADSESVSDCSCADEM